MARMNTTLALMLAASTPFALTQVASAQTDYEYEPDEGWHEEEWYDPSDWFDDEDWGYDTYDNEWDDDRYSDNSYYTWSDGYDTSTYGYSGYSDGYYDGYSDDEFGYDHWDADWTREYSTAYTEGYYDGYYDKSSNYSYDPTYYYFATVRTADSEKNGRERSKDKARERGDRSNGSADRSSPKADMSWKIQKRGTIEKMSSVDPDGVPENHTVLKLRLDNGKTVVADLGPKMTRDRLPFERGDRVTLIGERGSHDDGQHIVVQKLRVGDETVKLRKEPAHAYGDADSGRSYNGTSGDREWRRENASMGDPMSINGRIRDVWRSARDVDGHALYKVELAGGNTYVLAVRSDEAERLRMKKGDTVRIEGTRRTMEGRSVIDVNRIRGQSASASAESDG